jgi:hypothetical protein
MADIKQFNFELSVQDLENLKKAAKAEDRPAASLLRQLVKKFLSERATA